MSSTGDGDAEFRKIFATQRSEIANCVIHTIGFVWAPPERMRRQERRVRLDEHPVRLREGRAPQPGDEIAIAGNEVDASPYVVEWVRQLPSGEAPRVAAGVRSMLVDHPERGGAA